MFSRRSRASSYTFSKSEIVQLGDSVIHRDDDRSTFIPAQLCDNMLHFSSPPQPSFHHPEHPIQHLPAFLRLLQISTPFLPSFLSGSPGNLFSLRHHSTNQYSLNVVVLISRSISHQSSILYHLSRICPIFCWILSFYCATFSRPLKHSL